MNLTAVVLNLDWLDLLFSKRQEPDCKYNHWDTKSSIDHLKVF